MQLTASSKPQLRPSRTLTARCCASCTGPGVYTVVPESTHELGEPIQWQAVGDIGRVDLATLGSAVRLVAAVALLARHWPAQGSRHVTYLALSGVLLRAGYDADRVRRIVKAVAVATHDEETARGELIVDGTDRKIQSSSRATGWPTLASLLNSGAEVIGRVRDWLGLIDRPLAIINTLTPPPRKWPDPPSPEVYYGLTGKVVRMIDPVSEADPFAIGLQFLTCFGNVIGRAAKFAVEADVHCGNLYDVFVGRSAKARKGTSFGHVRRLFSDADVDWANKRVLSGMSSGEGLIWAVRDRIVRRDRVKGRTGPPQYEDVEADPGVSDKRLMVYEPEFAQVLRVIERTGNTLSPTLRAAWDTDSLNSLVKNSPARATGAHISLVGHITEDELRKYLPGIETGNGFGNRFCWACIARSKVLPEPGQIDQAVYVECREQLKSAIAFARQCGPVTRDPAAQEFSRAIYPLLSEGRPGLLVRADGASRGTSGSVVDDLRLARSIKPGKGRTSESRPVDVGVLRAVGGVFIRRRYGRHPGGRVADSAAVKPRWTVPN